MKNNTKDMSRRNFLTQTSYLGAMYAAAGRISLRKMADSIAANPRVSQTVVVDKGFASIRKIGDGLYATVSDTSKGLQTMCNGGFLLGKDGAVLIEGFVSAAGAAFQLETLRSLTQAPIKGALDTHYHFDHSLGNSTYGANGIPLFAHPTTAKRIYDNYAAMQTMDKDALLAPMQMQIAHAKSDAAKAHLEADAKTLGNVYQLVTSAQLTLPNHVIDPAKGPHKVDLGGLEISVEHFPGHSGTDMVVRVPAQNVVYTGDLLFNGMYPVTFDEKATVSGWRETLKTFASWDKDTIFVPGHGQICGQAEVALFRSTFDDIEEQASKMHKAGVSVEEAQHRYVVPEKFAKLGIFAWGFTIAPTIRQMYAEWDKK